VFGGTVKPKWAESLVYFSLIAVSVFAPVVVLAPADRVGVVFDLVPAVARIAAVTLAAVSVFVVVAALAAVVPVAVVFVSVLAVAPVAAAPVAVAPVALAALIGFSVSSYLSPRI
jgi:hypothetical protein